MKMINIVTGLGFVAIIGMGFIASVPDASAAKMHDLEGRKITMKVDMWQNIENLAEKGKVDKFWITLKSGKEIFCNIGNWGKGYVHLKLLNLNDGLDDGYEMIIDKNEIAGVKVQMREYK
ncbi:MAG: hypothetical protein OEY66_08125 [Gammaproteobacteria bacterium]|nr:hypothetical protein [Gammaproteobacteria bacterium]